MKICKVEGCEKAYYAKGFCEMHYARQRKHGCPHFKKPHTGGPARRPLAERFWERVKKGAGCWLWTGYRMPNGYGRMGAGGWSKNGGSLLAHRVSYELHKGSIPDGICVMHSCDNPRCVNPAHLSLGSQADNMADKARKGRARRKKAA
jgi:hypothetical protein